MKLDPKLQHEDSPPQVKLISLDSILEHAMDSMKYFVVEYLFLTHFRTFIGQFQFGTRNFK